MRRGHSRAVRAHDDDSGLGLELASLSRCAVAWSRRLDSREACVSIENLSLICIPFTLESMPVAYPADESGSHQDHRGGSLETDNELDLRWAGIAAA